MQKKTAFILMLPRGDRKSFAIQRRIPIPGEIRKYRHETVRDPRIDTLNKQLASGVGIGQLIKAAQKLRDDLYKEDEERIGVAIRVHHSENTEILERYLKFHFTKHPRNIDPQTARLEYKRAVESVGNLPLTTTDIYQLQTAINSKFQGNPQRRIVSRLKSVLKFLGRVSDSELLSLDKEDLPDVRFLERDEYLKVRDNLPDEKSKIFFDCLVYTGMRTGEVFGVTRRDIRGNLLTVAKQKDREMELRNTKNGKPRKAYIFKEGILALERWLAIPEEERDAVRLKMWADVIKIACKKTFPKDPSKHLVAHDLRHCYVIWLLGAGVSLHIIAKSIGDSVAVADKHYAGFLISDESVELIASKVISSDLEKSNREDLR